MTQRKSCNSYSRLAETAWSRIKCRLAVPPGKTRIKLRICRLAQSRLGKRKKNDCRLAKSRLGKTKFLHLHYLYGSPFSGIIIVCPRFLRKEKPQQEQ